MNSPLRDFSARKSRGERVGGEAITRAGSGAAVVSTGTWVQSQAFGSWRFECLPIHPPNCPFVQNRYRSSKNGLGAGIRCEILVLRRGFSVSSRVSEEGLGIAQHAHSSAQLPIRPEYVPFVQILHFVLDDKPFVRKRCAQGHKV